MNGERATVAGMDATERLSGRVADAIRRELGGRNLTKSELARRLGVSHTWVTNRLAGHQEIGLDELERIATALEVQVADLLPAATRPGTIDRSISTSADQTRHLVHAAHQPTGDHASTHPTGRPHRPGATTSSGRPRRIAWTHQPVTR